MKQKGGQTFVNENQSSEHKGSEGLNSNTVEGKISDLQDHKKNSSE